MLICRWMTGQDLCKGSFNQLEVTWSKGYNNCRNPVPPNQSLNSYPEPLVLQPYGCQLNKLMRQIKYLWDYAVESYISEALACYRYTQNSACTRARMKYMILLAPSCFLYSIFVITVSFWSHRCIEDSLRGNPCDGDGCLFSFRSDARIS